MKRTLTALTLALTTAFAVPAMAGGTITFGFNAKNQDEANAIRAGLAIYSLVKDIDTNGHITQNGINNAAGIAQGGKNNKGIIHQDGKNHDGTITQNGNNNACGLFQFGNGATGHVNQNGGEACLIFQAGF
ncbi:curlin [Pseudoruegeria sp. HB172150]|uniref:curlin n=1 Tax=Pseudoruegeria sp. HB172150 TaxID=2721164 RepID=UPI0015539B98|nr:curlin [Pseudoruegeria sp. HB172150]